MILTAYYIPFSVFWLTVNSVTFMLFLLEHKKNRLEYHLTVFSVIFLWMLILNCVK